VRPGGFNAGVRPGGVNPGGFNAGVRPGGVNPGGFNAGVRPGAINPGALNGGMRPGGVYPGGFNGGVRPGGFNPGFAGGARPGGFGARPAGVGPFAGGVRSGFAGARGFGGVGVFRARSVSLGDRLRSCVGNCGPVWGAFRGPHEIAQIEGLQHRALVSVGVGLPAMQSWRDANGVFRSVVVFAAPPQPMLVVMAPLVVAPPVVYGQPGYVATPAPAPGGGYDGPPPAGYNSGAAPDGGYDGPAPADDSNGAPPPPAGYNGVAPAPDGGDNGTAPPAEDSTGGMPADGGAPPADDGAPAAGPADAQGEAPPPQASMRMCRRVNTTATVGTQTDQTTELWCRGDNGDWAPAEAVTANGG
jgi:hypothetical protein